MVNDISAQQAKMDLLRQKYIEQMMPRIDELKAFIGACKANRITKAQSDGICATAHKLHGSGATYGFQGISNSAKALEDILSAQETASAETQAKFAQALVEACLNALNAVTLNRFSGKSLGGGVTDTRLVGVGLPEILCVADDESLQMLLPELFTSDARVIMAGCGAEALTVIEGCPPDLVVWDASVADMKGVEFLKRLSAIQLERNVPVVVLTSSPSGTAQYEPYREHFLACIGKPFDPNDFHKRILGMISRARQKVLIADDDEAIRDLLGEKFKSVGYRVYFAEDAVSAFEMTKKEIPDIVILDRMLPGGDGLLVYRKIRAEAATKRIPVLFLTAKRRESDILEALRQGANDYVVKPFKTDELFMRCVRLMDAAASSVRA